MSPEFLAHPWSHDGAGGDWQVELKDLVVDLPGKGEYGLHSINFSV